MDDAVELFFGIARSVALTPGERSEVFQALAAAFPGTSRGTVRNGQDVRLTAQMSLTDKNFTGKARTAIHLTAHEKSAVFQSLQNFMKSHPYAGDTMERTEESWSFFDVLRNFRLAPVLASVLVLVLGLGGTASYAAESALPGDALYPVKIYVNEGVGSSLAFSAEAKARLEARRAERRLAEAEELAMETRLTEKSAVYLMQRIEQHSAKAKQHLEELQVEGNAEVAVEIEEEMHTTLLANDSVLQKVAHSRKEGRREIAHLIKGVRELAKGKSPNDGTVVIAAAFSDETGNGDADTFSMKSELAMDAGASSSLSAPALMMDHKAEKSIDKAKSRLETVRLFIGQKPGNHDPQTPVESQLKIEAAESALVEAGVQLKAGSPDEANRLRKESLQNAEEAKLFKKVEKKLGEQRPVVEIAQKTADALWNQSKKKIQEQRSFLDAAKASGSVSVEALAAAELTLIQAQAKLDDAKVKLDAALYDESIVLSRDAARMIVGLKASLIVDQNRQKNENKKKEKNEDPERSEMVPDAAVPVDDLDKVKNDVNGILP